MIFIRYFISAVQFLSILPIPGNHVREEKDLARSMIFYPAVGLLIGWLTLMVYKFSGRFFVPAMSAVLALVFNMILTGGLHLDGFADTCDGFYAGKDKFEILTIMKDAHIGTMAVIGLIAIVLIKLVLFLSLLFKEKIETAFLVIPLISRWVMTVMASAYPYARIEGGMAKPFTENLGWVEPLLASIFCFLIAYYLVEIKGVLLCATTLAVIFVFMQWVKRKIGGITGDILGCVNELAEVSALFAFYFFLSAGGTNVIR